MKSGLIKDCILAARFLVSVAVWPRGVCSAVQTPLKFLFFFNFIFLITLLNNSNYMYI